MGAAAGVVGTLEAALAHAILTDEAPSASAATGRDRRPGELVVLDLYAGTRRRVTFRPRAACPACARSPLAQKGEKMATVRIPTPLRKLTGGAEEVSASGKTVGELIADLERRYPGLRERICEPSGSLRRFVNVFVKDEDIRFLKNLETPVADTDEVSIVPAIAGG
jgi:molybdopterin synthase sulfur carrier subunit